MLRNNHYHYSETYLVAAAERGNRLEEVRREWEAKIQSGELDPGDEEFDRFERKYDHIFNQVQLALKFAEVHSLVANNRIKDQDRENEEDDLLPNMAFNEE